jgi:membrane protease YdiL (CAAX protease family)
MRGPPRLAIYLAIVFALSYALQGVVWLRGGVESPAFERLAPVVMFVPGVTALFLLAREKGGWRAIPWRLGRWWYLVVAALIPAAMALALVALLSRLGLAESPHVAWTGQGVQVLRGSFVLGKGDQALSFFLVNVLASALVLGAVNGLVTVGEEIGWRGYLQPRLLARLRFPLAIALVGLIWAHWHTPVILMGYNYPESPVLGALLLWPATCVCWSFVAAWLTLNSGSLWPAVVLHGSVNAFLGGLVDGMSYRGPRLPADGIVLLAWVAVAALAYALTRVPVSPTVTVPPLAPVVPVREPEKP